MTETQTEPKPWERQKNEPNASYALFNEFLKIGPLRTLPKLVARVTGDDQFDSTLSLTNLKNKSAQWHWFARAESYDMHRIEEERAGLEKRAAARLLKRLDQNEQEEDLIHKKIIQILKNADWNKEYSKSAYAVSELSKAKKNATESQRLDFGEPTIIEKKDVKADVRTDSKTVESNLLNDDFMKKELEFSKELIDKQKVS